MENLRCNNSKQWRKDKILGRGAFGIVELWKNEKNGETLAIKKCHLDMQTMTSRQLERWQTEVRIMNEIEHPNIVGTREVPGRVLRENANFPVLCMEYCKKGDLRRVLNRADNSCGLNEKDALAIMKNISSAVEYLHGCRITHRDLKPENIVLQDNRGGTIYKLIDLGYAKELDHTSISASIVGTLNYLAPELLWRNKYSSSVDYWSLGILFYEILTGIRPFLPTMSINKTWMEHVLKKDYKHISIREIDGRVESSMTIDDPSHISQCLKDALVPWFRTVFQTDPSSRGKAVVKGESIIIVFRMLKSIFTKKVIHLFYVCGYKKEAYTVDESLTVFGLQTIIFEKEKIRIEDQILVSSDGRILDNHHQLIIDLFEAKISNHDEQEPDLMVFERRKLLINNLPEPVVPLDILSMSSSLLKNYDWQAIKRFYGVTVFFMKQELELFRAYIMAISIKADLCNENYAILKSKIKNILLKSASLEEKVQELSLLVENQASHLEGYQSFKILCRKINEFVDGARGMEKKLRNFEKTKDEWKQHFFSTNFTLKFEELCNDSEKELNSHSIDDRNKLKSAKKMLKLYFEFIKTRYEELTNKNLTNIGESFLQIENESSKLEESLKSFQSLLEKYQRDFQEFETSSKLKTVPVEPQRILPSNPSIIRDNIVLGHLITGILTEMEDIKVKLDSLE